MQNRKYYLGIDIGTDSIGYAATGTTPEYNLIKHSGEPVWGVSLFDPANTKAERRAFRTARRRLERRKQRVLLVQEIFADEISKKDALFYKRIKESQLLREDKNDISCLFNDEDFTDRDYHVLYPTIHHLIAELITGKRPHDVRLVYLACAWLVAHRGHFLSDISLDNIDRVTDFSVVYNELTEYFESLTDNYRAPWMCEDTNNLADALKKRHSKTAKANEIKKAITFDSKRIKGIPDPTEFPFCIELIIKLLAGSTVSLKELYGKEEYGEIDPSSVSLSMDDEKFVSVLSDLGDDGELLIRLKAIFDWSVLCDMLSGEKYISFSKVKEYEQHKADLKFLKNLIRNHLPRQSYYKVFKNIEDNNYVAYSGMSKQAHGDISKLKKTNSAEDFGKYIKRIVEEITPDDSEKQAFDDMLERIESGSFMPKQVTVDNRVIPYQLYYKELQIILENASEYLPFLSQKDTDGYTAKDKLLSIMRFRVPYYVGPLNGKSPYSWIRRMAEGKIYPWNFDEKVDLDESEQAFINKMTNSCTYLPGKDVLPKRSLLYEKFEVLNEINTMIINGVPVSVSVKQDIYNNIFLAKKKVSLNSIREYLLANNIITKEDQDKISGVDSNIKSSLSSHIIFKNILQRKVLNEENVEDIIRHLTYTEDRLRFRKWLDKNYSELSSDDRKYICSQKFSDFGRLSGEFLCELEGTEKNSGEVGTVIYFLWNRNVNITELFSDKYTFLEQINNYVQSYYAEHPITLDERLDEMCVSNTVKRPIFRTLAVVDDVVKALGSAPEKIFVEMARDGDESKKGKRTVSRKDRLIELYKQIKDETARAFAENLEKMGDAADSRLQSEALFLYYLQLGKCMYSGETIDINKLTDGTYNIDHIYPQSKVKDDNILNNKVLVLSTYNKDKGDSYPVPSAWRNKMTPFWKYLRDHGLMEPEKYNRLTRRTGFSEDEEWGFINRQLVETRQSTKAMAAILKEKYPGTKIVYVQADLVSDFRQEFGMLKCRSVNDLHHAKDAYLSIVCGNVYTEHFTKQWFLKTKQNNDQYNIKLSKLFGEFKTKEEIVKRSSGERAQVREPIIDAYGNPVFSGKTVKNGDTVVWNGSESFNTVRKTILKNSIHTSKYAFCRRGGFFDQLPVKKAKGLVPRKKGLNTAVYGGYNKPSISFFILTKYVESKKNNVMLVPIELMSADQVLTDSTYAVEYIKTRIFQIFRKIPSDISFPLGMRSVKINTVISLDGFEFTLSGTGNGGKAVVMAPFVQLKLSYAHEEYIKKLESVVVKSSANPNYQYDPDFDKVTSEQNIELYDLLLDKLTDGIYTKRINSPVQAIIRGREAFISLGIIEQSKALMKIIQVFGSVSSGIDLTLIEGVAHAGSTVSFSSNLQNWKKQYNTACIIDRSPSGLWEKRSGNLLELL